MKCESKRSTPMRCALTPSQCGRPTVTSRLRPCCCRCWSWRSPSSSTSTPSATFGSPFPSCRCSQHRPFPTLRRSPPLSSATPLLWRCSPQPISTTQRGRKWLRGSCGRRKCGRAILSSRGRLGNLWRVCNSKGSLSTPTTFTTKWKWRQRIRLCTSKPTQLSLSSTIA